MAIFAGARDPIDLALLVHLRTCDNWQAASLSSLSLYNTKLDAI